MYHGKVGIWKTWSEDVTENSKSVICFGINGNFDHALTVGELMKPLSLSSICMRALCLDNRRSYDAVFSRHCGHGSNIHVQC